MSSIKIEFTIIEALGALLILAPGIVVFVLGALFALMNLPDRMRLYAPGRILGYVSIFGALDLIIVGGMIACPPAMDWLAAKDDSDTYLFAVLRIALTGVVAWFILQRLSRKASV